MLSHRYTLAHALLQAPIEVLEIGIATGTAARCRPRRMDKPLRVVAAKTPVKRALEALRSKLERTGTCKHQR